MRSPGLTALLLLTAAAALCSGATTVSIVHIGPLTGDYVNIGLQAKKAINLAVETINQDATILPDYEFVIDHVNSKSDMPEAAFLSFHYGYELNYPMFIGDVDSAVSGIIGTIGGLFNVPQVSYASSSATLSDKDLYPYFTRVTQSDNFEAHAVMQLVKSLEWQNIGIITASSAYSATYADELLAIAEERKVTVQSLQRHKTIFAVENTNPSSVASYFESIDEALEVVKGSGVRVIIMPNNSPDARAVLYRAWLKGMAGHNPSVEIDPQYPFVWVGGRAWTAADVLVPPADDPCNVTCLDAVKLAVESSLGLAIDEGSYPSRFTTWRDTVWNPAANQLTQQEQTLTSLPNWAGPNMDKYVPFAYDAAMLAASALHAVCYGSNAARALWSSFAAPGTRPLPSGRGLAGNCAGKWNNASTLLHHLYTTTEEGLTGTFTLQAGNGSRRLPYSVQNMQSGQWEDVGTISLDGTVSIATPVQWPGNVGKPKDMAAVACAPGEQLEYSVTGTPFCVKCSKGFFNIDGVKCQPCPFGAQCDGGTHIAARRGFWQSRLSSTRFEFYDCRPDPEVCCPAGNCSIALPPKETNPTCASNRLGTLCGKCADGYSMYNSDCVPCHTTDSFAVFVIVVTAIAMVVWMFISSPSDNAVSKQVLDYLQLVSLIVFPQPGRKAGIAGILDNDLLNLNLSGFWSASDDQKQDDKHVNGCLTPLDLLSSIWFGGFAMPSLMLIVILSFHFLHVMVRPCGLGDAMLRKVEKCRKRAQKCCTRCLQPGAHLNKAMHANTVKVKKKKKRQKGERDEPKLFADDQPTGIQCQCSRQHFKFWDTPPVVVRVFWKWLFLCYGAIITTGFQFISFRHVDETLVVEQSPGIRWGIEGHAISMWISVGVLVCASVIAPAYIGLKYYGFLKLSREDSKSAAQRMQRITDKNLRHGVRLRPFRATKELEAQESIVKSLLPLAGALVSMGEVEGAAGEGPSPEREDGDTQSHHGAAEDSARTGKAPTSPAAAALHRGGKQRRMTWVPAAPKVMASALLRKDLAAMDRMESMLDHSKRSEMGAVYVDMFKLYRSGVRSWFESAYYIRKTLMSALTVFIASQPIWRQIALFVASMVLLFFHLLFRPYASKRDNVLGSCLMGSLALVGGLEVYSVAVFYVTFDEGSSDPATDRFVSVAHIVMMAWPVLFLVYFNMKTMRYLLKAWCARRRERKAKSFHHHQVLMARENKDCAIEMTDMAETVQYNPVHYSSAGASPRTPTKSRSFRNIAGAELGTSEDALRAEVRYLKTVLAESLHSKQQRYSR